MELVGVALTKLTAPLAHGLARHDNAQFKPMFLDVTLKEAVAVGEPDCVADDVDQEAVIFVRKSSL